MKVLVLGAGQMGSVVAKDLRDSGYEVTIADQRDVDIDGIKSITADLTSDKIKLFSNIDCDLIVCALPAWLGYGAATSAIVNCKDFVDLSYTPENMLRIDGHAKAVGTKIIPDCGIAPGISNLIVGRAVYKGNDSVKVYVGGFAKDESAPMGYAVSWSSEDLLDEYVRPARIILNGEIKTVDALTGMETIHIDGVGDLDAFYTDGLRTLLFYRRDEVKNRKATIVEKTMRRAGHMDEMKQLIKEGKLIEYISENCTGLDDMLVMRFDTGDSVADMIVYGDGEMSAMARTTALSCSAFAQLVLEGKIKGNGVIPPEVIAEDDELYMHLLDKLEKNGLVFSTKYPYI